MLIESETSVYWQLEVLQPMQLLQIEFCFNALHAYILNIKAKRLYLCFGDLKKSLGVELLTRSIRAGLQCCQDSCASAVGSIMFNTEPGISYKLGFPVFLPT